jgi:hypothetical protein
MFKFQLDKGLIFLRKMQEMICPTRWKQTFELHQEDYHHIKGKDGPVASGIRRQPEGM